MCAKKIRHSRVSEKQDNSTSDTRQKKLGRSRVTAHEKKFRHSRPAVRGYFFFALITLLCLDFFFALRVSYCAHVRFSLTTYPAVPLIFFALTLLCHYPAFRYHLPCCALNFFFSHLPCCACKFFFALTLACKTGFTLLCNTTKFTAPHSAGFPGIYLTVSGQELDEGIGHCTIRLEEVTYARLLQ